MGAPIPMGASPFTSPVPCASAVRLPAASWLRTVRVNPRSVDARLNCLQGKLLQKRRVPVGCMVRTEDARRGGPCGIFAMNVVSVAAVSRNSLGFCVDAFSIGKEL